MSAILRTATVAVALALVLFAASRASVSAQAASHWALDFRVVYCGETAIVHRADPYLTEPLRSCERLVAPEPGQPPWAVTPFPLPGYAAALLVPFALAPFAVAWWLWMATLLAAFAVTTAAVAAILRTRFWLVALVFAPTIGFLDIRLGEPVNIAIACVALAALALERGRPRLAAVAAACAMLEPAFGLPACCALFVLVPVSRPVLLGLGAAFAALSLAAVGTAASLAYVTTFLPLHAHSELFAPDQYSLTRVLFVAGIGARGAIAAGSVWYACAIALGVAGAVRLGARGAPRALIVLLPVATATFGGVFVHDVEISAALPAALVLATRSVAARSAVSLLTMRWALGWRILGALEGAAAFGWLSVLEPGMPLVRRLAYTAVILVALFAIDRVLPVGDAALHVDRYPPVTVRASTPSSIPWEWSIRLAANPAGDPRRAIVAKIPTWFALALVSFAFLELDIAELAATRRRTVLARLALAAKVP